MFQSDIFGHLPKLHKPRPVAHRLSSTTNGDSVTSPPIPEIPPVSDGLSHTSEPPPEGHLLPINDTPSAPNSPFQANSNPSAGSHPITTRHPSAGTPLLQN